MTNRATFGDFVRAATRELDRPPGPAETAGGRRGAAAKAREVGEVSEALLRVVTVMTRYLGDITTAFEEIPARDRHRLSAWARASIEAHDSLRNAAAFLQDAGAGHETSNGELPESPLAQRLYALARSLATGRDLLHTHFVPGPDGLRRGHSDWSPVVTSVPVTRALLSDLASCARRIAPLGAELALSRGRARDNGEARRSLNAACQWLWVLDANVDIAQRQHPVPADDRQLLHAIPVNVQPPRRLPRKDHLVKGLADGAIASAERVRHAARALAGQAPWSPAMTSASYRQTAAASVLTWQHCEILLRSLAARTAQPGSGGTTAWLLASADAAAHARAGWLATAHAWDNITTDTRGYITQTAVAAKDLALWTGRLAYADPAWTPASGPSRARPPASLAAEPADIPIIVAAIHHAGETMSFLARAEHEQIRTAGNAGRLHVPTRFLSARFDIPRPFAPAPAGHIRSLLSTYREAGTSSARAVAKVAPVAAAVRAPSHILIAAHAAPDPSRDRAPANAAKPVPGRAIADTTRQQSGQGQGVTHQPHHWPGPIERILKELGVSDPALLRRGSAIDHAAEQLVIGAAEAVPERPTRSAAHLSRSAVAAELINRALASRDRRAVRLVDPPESPQAEQLEAEP